MLVGSGGKDNLECRRVTRRSRTRRRRKDAATATTTAAALQGRRAAAVMEAAGWVGTGEEDEDSGEPTVTAATMRGSTHSPHLPHTATHMVKGQTLL